VPEIFIWVLVARLFQDRVVSPRMVNARWGRRLAHRVASVMSVRPVRRSAPMARLRRAAMTRGPDRVHTVELFAVRVSRSQRGDSMPQWPRTASARDGASAPGWGLAGDSQYGDG
jgi:hypothetical protein